MRTKEEIIRKMIEEMPYQLIGKDQVLPYIQEAMEIYARELVSESKSFDIHNCINEICDAVHARFHLYGQTTKGDSSFRWLVKQAIDKMLYSR
jgi:hypothetical protein